MYVVIPGFTCVHIQPGFGQLFLCLCNDWDVTLWEITSTFVQKKLKVHQ